MSWESYADQQEQIEAGQALADAIRALWELAGFFPEFAEAAYSLRRDLIKQWESGIDPDIEALPWRTSSERNTVWEAGQDPDDPNNYEWNPGE